MRITSTTSSPVMTKDTTAAGPVAWITTPLPTNRPAPMTPPRAIMVMCRCFKLWRSPLGGRGLAVARGSFTPGIVACHQRPRIGHSLATCAITNHSYYYPHLKANESERRTLPLPARTPSSATRETRPPRSSPGSRLGLLSLILLLHAAHASNESSADATAPASEPSDPQLPQIVVRGDRPRNELQEK